MRLPTPLQRKKSNVHKNNFGHLLILAGSKTMLGAGALTALSAMRAGAGLVTLGIPNSLNLAAQKKVSNTIMTLPLAETPAGTLGGRAYSQILKFSQKCNAIVIGPGLGTHPSTQRLILRIIEHTPLPLLIDAAALTALASNKKILNKNQAIRVLTPHPGEFSKLINVKKETIESNRRKYVKKFIYQYSVSLLLKGHKTLVGERGKALYFNTTGNSGMASAGSGDVLSGMIGAFLAQGLTGYQAAKFGAYLHGIAGDLAAKKRSKLSLIASDIIESIPKAINNCK